MYSIDFLRKNQNHLLNRTNDKFYRFTFAHINWNQPLIGIKGPRGTGKTTMMLQYLKYNLDPKTSLYASADNPFFYDNTIFQLAEDWVTMGGRHLILDEVHKLDKWSNEIKLAHDSFPELQIIFSSSSALKVYLGEGDLSRRLALYELPGLSFREFLEFEQQIHFDTISVNELFNSHEEISTKISARIKPVPLFHQYLRSGYFPFAKELEEHEYHKRLQAVINTVLEVDLLHTESYSKSNTLKLKKLLGIISGLVPFEPNISKLADRMKIGRVTLLHYLQHLQDARILNFLSQQNKGISALQKPDKIFLENTNLAFALSENPEIGNLRETFVISQFKNINLDISLPKKGDLLIDGNYLVEIGGKNKTMQQIGDASNHYLFKDNIETGFAQSIPLWLVGFLY